MGHCRDCSFYRLAKPPSELLGAAIGSNDAAVLTAIGKIQEDEKELDAQEDMFRARVEQRTQSAWGMRPMMSAYCGLEEQKGVFHIAEIRNRGLQCGDFTSTPVAPRDCTSCGHRVVPGQLT
jgi:DNA-directed RNA polymerase subunit RPC12/RpoP